MNTYNIKSSLMDSVINFSPYAVSNRGYSLFIAVSRLVIGISGFQSSFIPSRHLRATEPGRGAHKLLCRTRRQDLSSPLSPRRLVSHPRPISCPCVPGIYVYTQSYPSFFPAAVAAAIAFAFDVGANDPTASTGPAVKYCGSISTPRYR